MFVAELTMQPKLTTDGADEALFDAGQCNYATLLHQAGSQTEAAQVQAHAMGMKAWLHKKRPG